MNLGEKQELFGQLQPLLVLYAHTLGLKVRLFEVERTKAQARWNARHCRRCQRVSWEQVHTKRETEGFHEFKAIGIEDSLHCHRLAIDLGLFVAGEYLVDTADYEPLGVFWEGLHELCRWGGRFNDAGHFSITHEGRE